MLFRSIIGGLFLEGRMPADSIIDAGAHMGFESCYYAGLQPNRTVHAIDPLKNNVAWMRDWYGQSHPNIRAMHGGLGSHKHLLSLGRESKKMAGAMVSLMGRSQRAEPPGLERAGQTVQVTTVDELFSGQLVGEALGFAHWDVEGSELEVLRGASATLRRDQPVFTVELAVRRDPAYARELLDTAAAAGYDLLVVKEVCGVNTDCRNILALPRSRAALFADSPTLNLAWGSGTIRRLNASTLASYAAATKPNAPSLEYAQKWNEYL